MEIILKVVFFCSMAATLTGFVVYVRSMSGPNRNRAVAMNWFHSMDVISHGQRYQGKRSDIVFDTGSAPLGSTGYELILACRTRSGREYFVRVVSHMGLVTEWEVAPAEAGDFEAMNDGEMTADHVSAGDELPARTPA